MITWSLHFTHENGDFIEPYITQQIHFPSKRMHASTTTLQTKLQNEENQDNNILLFFCSYSSSCMHLSNLLSSYQANLPMKLNQRVRSTA